MNFSRAPNSLIGSGTSFRRSSAGPGVTPGPVVDTPGPGAITTPGPGASARGCWSRVGGHFLASHMLKLSHHVLSDIKCRVLSGIDPDIQSDTTSDNLPDIQYLRLSGKNSAVLPVIHSDILSDIILTFYPT